MTSDRNPADWDGAYILGALTPDEAAEYERFLSAEPEHAAALNEYTEIPALLDMLSPQEALALIDDSPQPAFSDRDPAVVTSLAAAADKRRKRSRAGRVATAMAAAAALLVIGGIVGYTAIPRESPTGVSLQAMAAGERGGVTASLAVSEEPWGTRLDWQCEYTKDWAKTVASYDLVVTTKDGDEVVVASWGPAGDQASNLAAATVIPTSAVRTVDIRESGTATTLAVTRLG